MTLRGQVLRFAGPLAESHMREDLIADVTSEAGLGVPDVAGSFLKMPIPADRHHVLIRDSIKKISGPITQTPREYRV